MVVDDSPASGYLTGCLTRRRSSSISEAAFGALQRHIDPESGEHSAVASACGSLPVGPPLAVRVASLSPDAGRAVESPHGPSDTWTRLAGASAPQGGEPRRLHRSVRGEAAWVDGEAVEIGALDRDSRAWSAIPPSRTACGLRTVPAPHLFSAVTRVCAIGHRTWPAGADVFLCEARGRTHRIVHLMFTSAPRPGGWLWRAASARAAVDAHSAVDSARRGHRRGEGGELTARCVP